MRPLRLDLHGFTVFREPTTVDFTDADFFALVGPTGAGKSTILDAICFALYGTVPRWGERRRIEHALAPSANEARVRLIFEAAGSRFVCTRVIRRDGKGRVSTSQAGLEQLPPGFDLAQFDTAPAQRNEPLGTVLAGTAAEMEAAVLEAVGLPYEQFTSCVVLPQGEFARFLHARPAERQEILVNLLGLHVYQRVGERAGVVQKQAEASAAAARSLLAELADTDDAALERARRAVAAAETLVAKIEAAQPALRATAQAGERAAAELARIETRLGLLVRVAPPAGLDALAGQISAAVAQVTAADAAMLAAEEHEEKLKAELAEAGDKSALSRLVDAYAQRGRLIRRVDQLSAGLRLVTEQQAGAADLLAKARATADRSVEALARTQQLVEAAQTADRAATLRIGLHAGQPCPVCEQTVVQLPPTPAPALTAARAKLAATERAAKAASAELGARDSAARDLERELAAAAAAQAESAHRLAELETTLHDAPPLSSVEAARAAIDQTERQLVNAADEVRRTRQLARDAATAARTAQERLRGAWGQFDTVRDTLAPLSPPPAKRDDLVGSWHCMCRWAAGAATDLARDRDEQLDQAQAALRAMTEQADAMAALFIAAGLPAPAGTGDPAAYRQGAALAAQSRADALARVLERRDQAARLTEQVAAHDQQAQVAKALALHLRADRFERWLLAEALDALVSGASVILRELSGGQYDLTHDKGEFFVVDYADAGLRRGVRTLSGGETFQASLALALALSDQLAGLSTSASLESILLDEGFGTLDAATLDMVAATLENLAALGERMVGVVTHVPALAERIPVRFEVTKDARGGASIRRTG